MSHTRALTTDYGNFMVDSRNSSSASKYSHIVWSLVELMDLLQDHLHLFLLLLIRPHPLPAVLPLKEVVSECRHVGLLVLNVELPQIPHLVR